MTIENLLDEMETVLESGKSFPFTSSQLVDVKRLKTAIENLRLAMPDELLQARKIASERKEILSAAQSAGDAIIGDAHKRAKALVAEGEITKKAEAAASELMAQARLQANELVEQAKTTALEITGNAQKWSNDMRQSASGYVEHVVAMADETLTASVNELRRCRQSLRAAAQAQRKKAE